MVVAVAVVVFALVILVAAVSDVSGAFLDVVIIATYDVFSMWKPFLWLSLWFSIVVVSVLVFCCFRCLSICYCYCNHLRPSNLRRRKQWRVAVAPRQRELDTCGAMNRSECELRHLDT